jgi:hypothetical protein
MKEVTLQNNRLEKLLSNTIEDYYSEKTRNLMKDIKPRHDNLIPDLYACSDEYLQKAFKHKISDFGYPRSSLGLSPKDLGPNHYDFYEDLLNKITKIGSYLGTPNNALAMSYPDKGDIGWHHTGNAPGYTILLT